MEHRAYSLLTEKSVTQDADFVYIEGIASTPSVDRVGDIVESKGARFKTPMPLLMGHDHSSPVGQVTFLSPNAKGIPFKAQLPVIKEAGRVKDRVDEAIHSMKYGLVSFVSIGFKAVADQVERLSSGGLRFKVWDLLEISLVVIPANPEAVITAIKAFDTQRPAHEGISAAEVVSEPAKGPTPAAKRGPVKLIQRKYK
jgi:Escherichia/Staphylococcus phage prohead protease